MNRPDNGVTSFRGVLWPEWILSPAGFTELVALLHPLLLDRIRQLGIPEDRLDGLCAISLPLAAWINRQKRVAPLVVGISGAQGAGKSTLTTLLRIALSTAFGHRVATLSLDDIYRTREERNALARTVHPLLRTRGVPGTHDARLGQSLITALVNAGPRERTLLPSFDKARDDREPRSDWAVFEGPADIVLFEGWCVGAVPQGADALSAPVNDLEATEDPDGTWRRYVNDRLAGEYAALFGMLDRLVMLRVPDMASVYRFRGLQERKLAASPGTGPQHCAMDGDALRRFIMHYERLTLWMLTEMPGRADVTLALDSHQQLHHLQILH